MNKIRKFELGIATGIYLLLVFTQLFTCVSHNIVYLEHSYGMKFHMAHQVFDYYKHYLLPLLAHITIVYLAFAFIHMKVMPVYYERQRYLPGILLSLLALGAVYLTLTIAFTWYYGYLFGIYETVKGVHTYCAKVAFVYTGFYSVLYIVYYALRRFYFDYFHIQYAKAPWFKTLHTDMACILAITVLLLVLGSGEIRIRDLLALIVFYSAGYLYTQYNIYPAYYREPDRRRMLISLGITSVSLLSLAIVYVANTHGGGGRAAFVVFVLYPGLAGVMGLSWWVSKMRHTQAATVLGLRKALTHSQTELDFLHWQINPHFLFNALNTLYGTALQEKADATSQGIQKLGDMMRFMLHDNLLEHIPVSKEIAYLQNYIALQQLRTKDAPFITIEINIDDAKCEHEIVPMLLIPFVENAFKHGVSLRKPSRISVSLSCTSDKIYFDVFNTVHPNRSTDLEQQESMGIGLKNVRQRLELLYPQKHELSIRETTNEFFVHLTLMV